MLEERGVEISKVYIVRIFIDVLVLSLQRKAMLDFFHFFNIVLRITAYDDRRRSPNCYGLILQCLSTTLPQMFALQRVSKLESSFINFTPYKDILTSRMRLGGFLSAE
jgi:hypothetical protein